MRQRPKLSDPLSGDDRVHPRRSGTQAVEELQQAIGNRAVTQLIEVARQPAAKTKKKPAAKPFYQEVYDGIAEEKKRMVRWKYKDYDTGKQVEGTPFGGFAIPFTRRVQVGFSWEARIAEHREAVRELKDLTAPGKLDKVVPPWMLPDSDLAPVD